MQSDRDLLKQALDFVRFYSPAEPKDQEIRAKLYDALRERLAQPEQSPLDRMAENARELGLDYEPVQKEKPDGRQTTGPLTDRTDHVRNGSDYTPEQTVRDRGAEWRPFLVEFTTQEGDFTVELWAVDWVHAQDRLEELKATARIKGEKKGVNND